MAHRGDTSEPGGRERQGFPLREDFPAPPRLAEMAAARDDGAAPRADRTARDRRADVLDRIRATPPGFVRTYGDVSPGAPRFAGTVLSRGHPGDVPWFRIVRADGSLAKGARQRKLLEAEGVPFRGEKVDMRAARLP